jgi:hypothetical protein
MPAVVLPWPLQSCYGFPMRVWAITVLLLLSFACSSASVDDAAEEAVVDLAHDVTTYEAATDTTPKFRSDAPPGLQSDGAPEARLQSKPCNGSPELCIRRFNEVAYVCTHNAMANDEEGWWAPNQNGSVTTQLEDGVRAFMLDTHYEEGETYLCHGYCVIGSKPLVDGLGEFTNFLAANPREVVTLIFESYISPEDTAAAFVDSGLVDLTYVHPPDTEWPTLGEMTDADTRVVVFDGDATGEPAWHHPVWSHCFETHWSNKTPNDFGCAVNRGSPDNALFILNHFLTDPVAKPELAEQVNHNPYFLDRALQCREERAHIPNFVTVDFYDIGDVFAVVSALNSDGQR